MAAQLTAMNGLAVNVQGACDQFLAGAGLAEDENRGETIGRKADRLLHAPHAFARSDQRVHAAFAYARRRVRAGGQAVQQGLEFVSSDRLGEMIEGTEPHGFDRVLCAGKGRQDHDRRRVVVGADSPENLDAINPSGHPKVEQHGIDLVRERSQSFAPG